MEWLDWLAVLVPVALVVIAGQMHRAETAQLRADARHVRPQK